jgi:FixJ family two-component response regulator
MQDARRPLVAVVDDDEAVRDSLRFLLEIAGYDVATFASACAFLHAAPSGRPACLVVDQHMPNLTGLELLRRLHAAGDRMPSALMTGSPSEDVTREALSLGAAAVLEKPLVEEHLFRFIEAAIG